MFHIGDTVRVIHDTNPSGIGKVDKIEDIHLTKDGIILCELRHQWCIYTDTSLELVEASDYPEEQTHNVGDIVRLTTDNSCNTYRVVTVRQHTISPGIPTILYRLYNSNDDERSGSRHLVRADELTSVPYSLF